MNRTFLFKVGLVLPVRLEKENSSNLFQIILSFGMAHSKFWGEILDGSFLHHPSCYHAHLKIPCVFLLKIFWILGIKALSFVSGYHVRTCQILVILLSSLKSSPKMLRYRQRSLQFGFKIVNPFISFKALEILEKLCKKWWCQNLCTFLKVTKF